jgi:hypothetical protein
MSRRSRRVWRRRARGAPRQTRLSGSCSSTGLGPTGSSRHCGGRTATRPLIRVAMGHERGPARARNPTSPRAHAHARVIEGATTPPTPPCMFLGSGPRRGRTGESNRRPSTWWDPQIRNTACDLRRGVSDPAVAGSSSLCLRTSHAVGVLLAAMTDLRTTLRGATRRSRRRRAASQRRRPDSTRGSPRAARKQERPGRRTRDPSPSPPTR